MRDAWCVMRDAWERSAVLDSMLADFFSERPEVISAYLFGSQAKGTATAASDVDIALLLDPAFDLETHFAYRLEQIVALESVCRRPVDVVILNQAPLVLRNQVLKYGRLIYEGDHRQRVAFEVRSRFEYYDFKPVLDLLHSTLLRQIQEVGLAGRYRGHYNALDDARRTRERFEGSAGNQF
jgi:predicted nucleotidyltransferase